jgi:pimeloyl-ACP methyl ester carboxylesterase
MDRIPIFNLQNSSKMIRNIVLVHGAWADGSGWEGVHNILTEKGFNVTIVPNPNTSLADDVKITKAVLDRQDGPTVLVGHSYGGAIITEAGDHKNVKALVYVAAFAPDAGESLLKMQEQGPPDPDTAILPPENGFIWLDKSKFHSHFCADLPEAKAQFMADSQTPVGLLAFTTELTVAAWKTQKSWYIVASEDRMIPPQVEKMMAQRAESEITEIKGSHAVYIGHADKVAEVIIQAANNAK